MIHLIWTLSVHTRYDLRRYVPTSRLLGTIRRRPNLKWGIPAMLLAVPYLLITSVCTNASTRVPQAGCIWTCSGRCGTR
ncbi:hypothetical protein [Yimella sp. RIT 621]|uniref:hypothetical protein n=1 Tax=Yimella sp. RIT 621 TaxID=2510323 RepID=UPI0026810585